MIQFYSALMIIGLAFFTLMAGPSMAVGTSDGSSETAAAPYDEAKAMVDEGSYAAALPKLVGLVQNDPGNADAWNLLGFTYRKLGQLEDSDAAYLKVLAINPDHLGALEYQGELFITQGKIDAAKANLVKLQGLCGNCEEAEDLEKALKAAGA
ncbi:tetratricopeptide repeat protein [Stagnihabitans tardus]|uniref:Tetratricopeptide repeat protein n=1 Tax=Stagnihabitans tardus TaxID=2699202 RepID=A0AAE4Y643_9RHOB|nr:tetratricopeptide repeat protein [Stagnihabitans tardus]NBZ86506.1 tetratricopeptide repeat protein [Stagnihabitans tardus]